jgi:hypothetical protein
VLKEEQHVDQESYSVTVKFVKPTDVHYEDDKFAFIIISSYKQTFGILICYIFSLIKKKPKFIGIPIIQNYKSDRTSAQHFGCFRPSSARY